MMIKIRKLKDEELQRAQWLARKFGYDIEQEKQPLALGACEDEKLIGFCLGRAGISAELFFFYVHGRFRRRGIARRLVDTFVQLARSMGQEQVVAEFITDGKTSPYLLLDALGFSGLQQCGTLLIVPLGALALSEWAEPPAAEAAGMFQQVSSLSEEAFSTYRKALKRSAPPFANLDAVQGILLKELSWFLADENGTVRNSLLFADYDGELYLHSLYFAKGWERGLPTLIHLALSGAVAQADRYDRLYVACMSQASYRLAMRIGEELPITQRTAWRMYRPCR
jgi:GNAT superfamily N-acetyltransferase